MRAPFVVDNRVRIVVCWKTDQIKNSLVYGKSLTGKAFLKLVWRYQGMLFEKLGKVADFLESKFKGKLSNLYVFYYEPSFGL